MRMLHALRRPRPLSWGLAGLFAALYACVAVNRHRRMLTQAYDLGIFEQAVRAYAHGEAPVVLLKGPGYQLLGDHFHPLLATLAPLYRLFPGAVTLLLAQAVLMALAVVPLARWAFEVGGPRLAVLVGGLTGVSWGIVEAAADDFHEIAFAVPLLAFAATALGRGRPVAGVLWALPLVLVKEDLGLTAAVVGALVFVRAGKGSGTRALGFGAALFGLAATALTVLVVLPSFNPDGGFDYWGQMGTREAAGAPWELAGRLVWPPLKWLLLALAAATAGFLGLRSPLVLLCVPTLGWRLATDNSHYWGVSYHYSAVLMPLLLAALVDAVRRTGAFDGPGRVLVRSRAAGPGPALVAVRRARRALAVAGLVALVTLPVYPLHELVAPGAWGTSPRLERARAMLARIPDGATVAASNRLAAQLAGRTTVGLACREPSPPVESPVAGSPSNGSPAAGSPSNGSPAVGSPPVGAVPAGAVRGGPDWVVVDLADPSVQAPCAIADTLRMLDRYERLGYRRVVDDGDLRLLGRP
ncbi:Predicted membrane protein [Streptomyces sp. TLI_053]|nr:Predicted membrane protein [Streptomyces sp. TLI_053]